MTTEIDDSSKSRSAKNEGHRNIGFMMQDAREKAGFSIERAAMSTRITPAFIEALEQERFEVLPGAIFGRGFIRNLCRTYGCDPEGMIRAYDAALMQKAHPEGESRDKVSTKQVKVKEALAFVGEAEWKSRVRESVSNYYGKGKPYLLIAPIVVLGIYAAQAVYNRKEEPVPPIQETTAETIAEPTSVAAPVDSPTPPAGTTASAPSETAASTPAQAAFDGVIRGEGIEAVEIYVKEPVNIGTTRDRERQTSETMRPGAYKLQFNEQLKLYVEDMSAVEIRFKGQPIPNRGVKGEKRFMTFAVSESAIAKSAEKTKL